jgi:DNA polymerase-3 subunit epsilon
VVQLAWPLFIYDNHAAHRAEWDARVTSHLHNRIGERRCRAYERSSIAPSLLEAVTRQSAAKVHDFLSRRLTAHH